MHCDCEGLSEQANHQEPNHCADKHTELINMFHMGFPTISPTIISEKQT